MESFVSRIKDFFNPKPEYPQLQLLKEHQKLKACIRSCKTMEHFNIMYTFTHRWVDRVIMDKNFKHADYAMTASLGINILQYLTIKEKELLSPSPTE